MCVFCGIPIHIGKLCNKCYFAGKCTNHMENYRYEDGLPKQFDLFVENNLLLKEAEKLFKQVFETLYNKNADYSNSVNPFSNFENSAQRVGITVQQGILVRFNDKVERLCNLLRPGKEARVTGETIEDTICDAIGYLAILHAFRVGQMADGKDSSDRSNRLNLTDKASDIIEYYYSRFKTNASE